MCVCVCVESKAVYETRSQQHSIYGHASGCVCVCVCVLVQVATDNEQHLELQFRTVGFMDPYALGAKDTRLSVADSIRNEKKKYGGKNDICFSE